MEHYVEYVRAKIESVEGELSERCKLAGTLLERTTMHKEDMKSSIRVSSGEGSQWAEREQTWVVSILVLPLRHERLPISSPYTADS